LDENGGIVLLASPSILSANDAPLLAGIVDGVILVVGAGSANRYQGQRAKEQLDPIGTGHRRGLEPVRSENPSSAKPALSWLLPQLLSMNAGTDP